MFLGVAETIVSSLLCCGVGIVQCLFNLLYYVIGVRNTKKPPIELYAQNFCENQRVPRNLIYTRQPSTPEHLRTFCFRDYIYASRETLYPRPVTLPH